MQKGSENRGRQKRRTNSKKWAQLTCSHLEIGWPVRNMKTNEHRDRDVMGKNVYVHRCSDERLHTETVKKKGEAKIILPRVARGGTQSIPSLRKMGGHRGVQVGGREQRNAPSFGSRISPNCSNPRLALDAVLQDFPRQKLHCNADP